MSGVDQIDPQMERWLADPNTILAAVQNMKERAHFWRKENAGVVFRAAERHAALLRSIESGEMRERIAAAVLFYLSAMPIQGAHNGAADSIIALFRRLQGVEAGDP